MLEDDRYVVQYLFGGDENDLQLTQEIGTHICEYTKPIETAQFKEINGIYALFCFLNILFKNKCMRKYVDTTKMKITIWNRVMYTLGHV